MIRRIALFIILAIMVLGCSKKFLKYEKSADLGTINEYDKLIEVKELPTPTPGPQIVEEAKSPEKIPTATPTPKKLAKKKKAKVEKEPIRLPKLEDAEDFEGRRPIQDPFRVGEKVTLMLTYFGVSAGDMIMEVRPFVEVNKQKAYRFLISLKSSSVFSMFYSVDDWGETFLDFEKMIPYTFSIHAKESKQLLEVRTFFDWQHLNGSRWERKVTEEEGVKETKIEWPIEEWAQNIFSAIFYLRAFKLTPKKVINFRVADRGKNYVISGEVLRRETITTDVGTFKTVVLRPKVQVDGIFQPMGEVLFWLTDDDRKFYVKIEAEIKIGKIVGKLKSIVPGQP